MNRHARSELVALLVDGRIPIEPIREELATYRWDAEEPLVVLERRHIATILQRYLRGDLTTDQVGAWAEAIELRDDIGFPEQDASALKQLIFVLGNPVVNGDLAIGVAEAILATIETEGS